MATFGQRLKISREKRNLTQKQIADILGVSESTIGKYENDQRTPPPDTITKLADFFNVSTDYLLGRDGQADPNEAAKATITNALSDDLELLEFWKELQKREDLQIFFKQVKSLSPSTIKRVMRYIKMVEDEEAMED